MQNNHPSLRPQSLERRRFLTHGAALAGAAAISAAALGDQATATRTPRPVKANQKHNQIAPDAPIRIALLGAGGMGGGHLDSLLGMRERGEELLEIVGVAEVCKPRLDGALAKLAEKQPSVAVTSTADYRTLLGRDDVHALLIATPEHWHATMAVEALQAGKDVYVEKPMTRTLEDALWLERQVATGKQICQIGTQYMMKTNHALARELIAAGAIGKPTLSQTSYCRNSKDGEWLYEIDPNVAPGELLDWKAWCGPLGEHAFDTEIYHRWRRYKTWSTGIIGDLLVHQMTPLIYALDLGAPRRVTASGGHYVDTAMENHDQVFVTVEFGSEKEGNAHTMIVAGSTCNDRGLETLIRGHQADLLLGDDTLVKLLPQTPFVDDVDPVEYVCETCDWQDALRKDWLACIRSREPNRSMVGLGVKHMVVVELATRSIWEGGAFTYDPATGQVARA